nr:hypothetical protein [Nostoc sp. KVJ3]
MSVSSETFTKLDKWMFHREYRYAQRSQYLKWLINSKRVTFGITAHFTA